MRRQRDFYNGASDEELMIRNFVARSIWCNELVETDAAQLGMPTVRPGTDTSVYHVCRMCLEALDLIEQ